MLAVRWQREKVPANRPLQSAAADIKSGYDLTCRTCRFLVLGRCEHEAWIGWPQCKGKE
jgi:hypothetical protein